MSTKRALLVTVVAAVALSAAGVSGWSMSSWFRELGETPTVFEFGRSRDTRSDDWAVTAPIAVSQALQAHPFARTTNLVGDGQYVVDFTIAAPVRDAFAFFRPQTWGYFVGADVGLAWAWWIKIALLFWGTYFALTEIFVVRRSSAAWGAASMVLLPFFQFWSFTTEPQLGLSLLAASAVPGLLTEPRPPWRVLRILGIAWLVAASAICLLYPPFQVPWAHLTAVLVGSAFVRRPSWRGGLALGAAAALGGAVTIAYARAHADLIRVLSATAYPGQRLSWDGGGEWGRLFGAFRWFSLKEFHASIGSVAETGTAFFWGLALACAAAATLPKFLRYGMTALIAVWLVHYGPGWPHPAFAKLTGLSWVPPHRLLGAFAVVWTFLVTVAVDRHAQLQTRGRGWRLGLSVAPLVAAAFILNGSVNRGNLAAGLVVAVVLNQLFARPSLRAFHAVYAAITLYFVLWYNPLVVRPVAALRETPVAQALITASTPESRWIAFGSPVTGDVFRLLGLRSLDGTHVYPQFNFWKTLDPSGESNLIYNRFAHVHFEVGARDELTLTNSATDAVLVRVHPDHPALARLGINRLLVDRKWEQTSATWTSWPTRATAGRWLILSR